MSDESKPLWEYVAEVADNLGRDAWANMEGADGDVFQIMDELFAEYAAKLRLAGDGE